MPDLESEIRQRIPTVTDFSQDLCLAVAEAAELQALCDLNPQAMGNARELCDTLGGGSDPCGGDMDLRGAIHANWVICSADGHLTDM